MPERNPTRNPQIIAGTTLESGTPNTGQVLYTEGGTKTYSKSSGVVGPDVLIHAGAGRLDGAFFHDSAMLALSGVAVTFYDAGVVASGGPIVASGHKIVGTLSLQGGTGMSGARLAGGMLSKYGFAYTSGLCHTTASGQAGFSCSYTPVVSG